MPEKKNGKGIPQGIQGNVTYIFHIKIISQEFFLFSNISWNVYYKVI